MKLYLITVGKHLRRTHTHTYTNFAHHTSGREASADLLLLPKNLAPATRPPSPDQIVKKCDEKTKAFAATTDATNFFGLLDTMS